METKLTPEQKRALDKLGSKFLLKSLWNGIHHALMAVAMNIILFMAVQTFFEGDGTIGMIGTVLIGLFVFTRVLRIFESDLKNLQEEARKIVKTE